MRNTLLAASAAAVLLLGLPLPTAQADGAAPATRSAAPATREDGLERTLGLSPAERLVLRDRLTDADGTTHLRFDRTWNGLPVVAGDLVVHQDDSGRILGVDRASEADLGDLSAEVEVTPEAASATAEKATGLARVDGSTGLVVLAQQGAPRLAYRTLTRGERLGPHQVTVYVDAVTGRESARWDAVGHADGTGKSLYAGKVALATTRSGSTYKLIDPTRGKQAVYDAGNQASWTTPSGTLVKDDDNVWGTYRTAHRQSAAVDAAYGAAVTWDYLRDKLGRLGVRNDGVAARSYVHAGVDLDDAYWLESCFCVVYGDGATGRPLVSVDLTAHELAHGMVNATAGLIPIGEAGALGEATGDMLASAVEFSAGNDTDPGDYLIGERVVTTPPGFVRRLDRPSADGSALDCWHPTLGADDVHDAAGPADHFFYLVAQGSGARTINGVAYDSPTCNGATLSGIGRDKAMKIWYRALTVHLTSTSGYREARDATIRAARALYGDASTECKAVVKAWAAVAVPVGSYGCSGAPGSSGANRLQNGGFELGEQIGWSAPAGVITGNPRFFGARTGSWHAFMNSYGATHTDTVSQVVRVPAKSTATLRFQLAIFSMDSRAEAHDTFTVSVVDSGTRTALLTLDNTDAAWAYAPYRVDLSAYAGRKVTLEFTGREDDAGLTAYLLDDVAVTPR